MRWKEKKQFEKGETRIVKRFCLSPILAGGEYRWLELVQIEQVIESYETCYEIGFNEYAEVYYWKNVRFVDN